MKPSLQKSHSSFLEISNDFAQLVKSCVMKGE